MRNRIKRNVKRLQYIALGLSMCSVMYAAMIVHTFGKTKGRARNY